MWPRMGNKLTQEIKKQKVNRNKKSVGLSFAESKGTEILHKLAASSDILVENYLPGTLKKYRMDYDTIHALNPRYGNIDSSHCLPPPPQSPLNVFH